MYFNTNQTMKQTEMGNLIRILETVLAGKG